MDFYGCRNRLLATAVFTFIALIVFSHQTLQAQSSPPNSPVISKIDSKNVSVGQTIYTNAGSQGSASVTITFEGFAEAGSTITLYNGTTQLSTGTVTAQSNGAWQAQAVLSQGNYSIIAYATNAAGTSPASDPAVPLVVDTTAPTLKVVIRSTWLSDMVHLRISLQAIYAQSVADPTSGGVSSGLDWTTATGELRDVTDSNSIVASSIAPDYANRIDIIPDAGFGQAPNGAFINYHQYTATVTIRDKAGNIGTYTKTMYADYTYGITIEGMYIYDPAHATALNNNELGIGEPANNYPTTTSSPLMSPSGKNYGAGWVRFYTNMSIYTNPTKMIIKISPNDIARWQRLGEFGLSRLGEYIDDWVSIRTVYPHPDHNGGTSLIDQDGWFESKLHLKPKARIRHWFYPYDNAGNRVGHNFYYYTKTGKPATPVLTDAGYAQSDTQFSISDPRIVPGTTGTVDQANNNLIVRRYLNSHSMNWKTVVIPQGQTYTALAGQYDHGDTFDDLNNNWQWDSGEPFADYYTTPTVSDGKTFHLVNPNNATLNQSGLYTSYHLVYDPVSGYESERNQSPHRIYKVDINRPVLDNIIFSDGLQQGNVLYLNENDLPSLEIKMDDYPFYTYYTTLFTYKFDQCKVEIVNSSNQVMNPSNTGTFFKESDSVSQGTGLIDLETVIGSLPKGDYTVKVTIVDNFGNSTVDTSRTLRVDGDAPTVTGITPPQSSLISALPNFQATLFDLSSFGGEGSGISFGSGDQAISDMRYSQLRPMRVLGNATANGQTLILPTPLLDHTGDSIATVGQTLEIWQEDQSETVDTATITDVSGGQATITASGNLQTGISYTVLYPVDYYHASNGIDTLSANPIDPIEQDGYYVVQVRAVDKVGNTSITSSHYRLEDDEGDPTYYSSAYGPFGLQVVELDPVLGPGIAMAGQTLAIVSDEIKTREGNNVFDGTLVTVTSTFGTIPDADQDQFTPGIQVKTTNGRITFHVTSTGIGTGVVSATVGDAYSSPNPSLQFIPNYPDTLALNADRTSLTADGAGLVELTSGVITDQYGHTITPTSNTPYNQFTVTAPGFDIMETDVNASVAGIQVTPGADGILRVTLRAGTTAQATSASATSIATSGSPAVPAASDSVDLTLTPDVPGQPITLSTNNTDLIAQTSETTLITSSPIVDANGNTVADGTLVTVTTTRGSIISQDADAISANGIQRATQNGVITFQVSAQSATVGSATVTATSVEGSASGSRSLSFIADVPHGSITLSATPPQLIADGSDTATLTGSPITDQYGNPVGSGINVQITTTAGNLRADAGSAWSAGPVTVQTAADSTITFELQSSLILEQASLTATSQTGSATGSIEVSFVAGQPSGTIVLTTSVSELINGSADTAVITGSVKDPSDHPVADGTLITISLTSGTILSTDADETEPLFQTTTTDGQFSCTINAINGSLGTCLITASSVTGTATGQTSVDFIAGEPAQPFTLTASPQAILADGQSTSTIESSAIRDDYDNIVASGELITVTASAGDIITADAGPQEGFQAAVSAAGTITLQLRSTTTSGTSSITAASVRGTATGSTTVTFEPGIAYGTIVLSASPDTMIANSGQTSLIVSDPITDSNNNIVANGTFITVQTDRGEITSTDTDGNGSNGIQIATSNGIIQFELSSSLTSGSPVAVGTAIIDAFGPGNVGDRAEGSTQVTMTQDVPFSNITLHPQTTPLIADATSQTTITSDPIKDRYDNPIASGQLITVSTTLGEILEDQADDIIGNQIMADAAGSITFTLRTGTQSGSATITAISYMGTAQGQTSVPFNPDVPTGQITLTTAVDQLELDGTSSTTVSSGVITDANGNTVLDGTLVTVAATSGSITTPDADTGIPGKQVAVSSGIITFTVSSANASLGTATISADSVSGDAYGETTIEFIPGSPQGVISLTATPATIVADPYSISPVSGVTTTTTVTSDTITDAAGNGVSDDELFTVYATNGEIQATDEAVYLSGIQVYASNGSISFTYSSYGAPAGSDTVFVRSVNGSALGTATITLTDTGIIEEITIILDEARPNSDRYVPWNMSRAVIVQCYDALGNEAAGDTVTLSVIQNNSGSSLSGYTGYPGSGSSTQWSGQTDAQGRFYVTYTTPADPNTGIDYEDILDAHSAFVDASQVTNRRFIVTQTVPPLFNIVTMESYVEAGAYTPIVIELIDLYDSHITDVTGTFPGLQVLLNSSPAPHDTTGNFYTFDSQSSMYTAIGQNTAASLDWGVDGYATIYYRDTKSGTPKVHIEDAADPDVIKPIERSINVVPIATTGAGALTLHTSAAQIIANGSSLATITSDPITDPFGNILEGTMVTVSSTLGTILALDVDGISANGIQVISDENGIISFELRSISTVGTATVSAQAVTGTSSDTVDVDFIPGAPNGPITLIPDATEILADGSSTVHIESSIIYDTWGNVVSPGQQVSVAASRGSIVQSSPVVTDTSGKIQFDVQSSVTAGTATVTATSVQGNAAGSVVLSFIPDAPAGTITLHASPDRIIANSTNASLITSDPITDGVNVVSDGELFTVWADRGSISTLDEDGVTEGIQVSSTNGEISFLYNPNTSKGMVTIYAQSVSGTAYGTVDIELIGAGSPYGPLTLNASPISIPADGVSTSTITTDQMTDRYGNIVDAGALFQVTTDNGTINDSGLSTLEVASGDNGILTFTIQSSTVAAPAQVTVQSTSSSSSGSITLTFEPGAPSGLITLQAQPSQLIAKSNAQSTIRVPAANPIRDSFGNIVADGTVITVQTTAGKLLDNGSPVDQMTATTSAGIFSVTLSATDGPATAVISAQSGAATGSASVTFVPDVAAGTVTLTPNPANLVADGSSTTQITSSEILDQYGTRVAQGTLFTVTRSSGTILTADADSAPGLQIATDSQGILTFTLRSATTAGISHVTVQSVQGTASGATDVTFEPGEPAGTFTLTPVPSTLIAKSDQTSTITSSTIVDANGNSVGAGIAVTITATGITVTSADTDGNSTNGIQVLTNASSTISCTVQADSTNAVGPAQVTAQTVPGSAVSASAASVSLVADVPAGSFTLTPSPAQIIADGATTSQITSSVIHDQYGNVVPEGTLVTVATDWGTFVEQDADPDTYPGHQIAAGADGTASVTLQSEQKVGTAAITASTPEGTASGSTTVTGIPGAVTDLIVVLPGETFSIAEADLKSGSPAQQTINISFNVTVYPVDANGNHVTDTTMSVTMDQLTALTTCSPSFTQSFDGSTGELIFAVQDTIAGQNLVINVEQTGNEAIAGQSTPFTIKAGDPVQLQILLPGQTRVPGDSGSGRQGTPVAQNAGVAFDVVVNYVDEFYNLVTDAVETIQLSSSGVNAELPNNQVLSNGSVTMTVTEHQRTLSGSLRQLRASLVGYGQDTISVLSDPFEVSDTMPPELVSFTINNGDLFTLDQTVTLQINAFDAALSEFQMQLRNENQTWAQASPYEPYAAEKTGYMLSAGYAEKTVYVRFKDENGNESGEFAASIVYGSPPTANAGGTYTGTEGIEITLDGSGSNDPAGLTLTYNWDIDADGQYDDASGQSISHTWNDNGTYTIGLRVENTVGQSDTTSTTVTVSNADPIVSIQSIATVYEGDTVNLIGSFTDSGTADTHTYDWDFGDGSAHASSLTTPHIYANNGSFTATLTVTDDDGGIGSQSVVITVQNKAPVVQISAANTADEGDIVSFTGSFIDAGTLDSHTILWDFGDTNSLTGSLTPDHVYTDNGTYTVTLTVTDDSGEAGSDTFVIEVSNLPPVVDAGDDRSVAEGEEITLDTASYTDAGSSDTHTVSITWGDDDTESYAITGGTIDGAHRFLDYGTYTVVVDVQDDDGESDNDSFTVTVGRVPLTLSITVENDLSATLSFNGIVGKEYDIWYSEDDFAQFGSSFNWTLADTVTVSGQGTYTDSGDPAHPGPDGIQGTADDGRAHPSAVPVRYYRVVEAGSIDAGDPWCTQAIAFYRTISLYPGRNFIGQTGTAPSLATLFDPRFLPGGGSVQNAPSVQYWVNSEHNWYYLYSQDELLLWTDGQNDAGSNQIPDGCGMLVTLPAGMSEQTVPVAGIVSMTESVDITLEPGTYTLVSWPYANAAALSECGLAESGFKGASRARTADQIYFWNPQTQSYDLPVFLFSGTNEWRFYDQSPCDRKLQPGEAVLIRLQPDSTCTTWHAPRPYEESTRQMAP